MYNIYTQERVLKKVIGASYNIKQHTILSDLIF